MSLKIAQNTAASTARVNTPATGAGASQTPAPGALKADGFDGKAPVKTPLPPELVGPDFGYRMRLRNMSDEQLQLEQFSQEVSLLVSQFTGDYQGANDARRKLGYIRDEQDRRIFGGGDGHQVELAQYRGELRKMNDWQLASEERKQQSAYWYAMLTGNEPAAQLAQEKLEAVHAEQDRRWTYWPVDPLPVPMPPERDPKGGPINY